MRATAWLLMAGLLAIGAAWALDPPRPVPPAPQETTPASAAAGDEEPPAATAPATGQEEGGAQQDGEEEVLPPLPAESKPTGPTPQRFDPSEEVRADFPVSFPVDI